jgi:hypothetical protein
MFHLSFFIHHLPFTLAFVSLDTRDGAIDVCVISSPCSGEYHTLCHNICCLISERMKPYAIVHFIFRRVARNSRS